MPKQKRPRKAVTIDRNKVYSVEAAKQECGLGRPQLSAGRKAGVLHPSGNGRFRYYDGAELAAWVLGKKAS